MKKCSVLLALLALSLLAGCQNKSVQNPHTQTTAYTRNTEETASIPAETLVEVLEIIDISQRDMLVCASAIEPFYTDGEYIYSFGCIKSHYITVVYTDGSEQNVKEALEEGRITVTDLDRYGISYYKENKIDP